MRLARFGAVGAAATLLHAGLAALAFAVSGRFLASHALGFLAAFAFASIAHFHFTFRATDRFAQRTAAYFAISGSSFVLSSLAGLWMKAEGAMQTSLGVASLALIAMAVNFTLTRVAAYGDVR